METEKKFAETYGGKFGAVLPLAGMIGAIVVLCIAGMSSMRNFWGAGLLAIAAGMLVYKDKNKFGKAAMKGFASPSFTMLFPIFIMAGILGQILTASKLVDGLVYIMSLFNIPAAVVYVQLYHPSAGLYLARLPFHQSDPLPFQLPV